MTEISPELPLHINLLEKISKEIIYNAETGLFHWLKGKKGRRRDRLAGTCDSRGYMKIFFFKRYWQAHQLAWLLTHHVWAAEIDHINGKTSDNRLCNLRPATRSQNNMNGKLRNDNKSGHKGVTKQRGTTWKAFVWVLGKRIDLGKFQTKEAAIEARQKAELEHYKEYRRG